MATNKQRAKLLAEANYLVAHKDKIHYAATRPMRNINTSHKLHFWQVKPRLSLPGGSFTMDCSESVTLLCYWAGLKDPNGLGYQGWGNSGTMWKHLPKYEDPNRAHTGALVVYGNEGSEHVCMVMAHDRRNPWLFSHGSEAGPLHIRLSDESAAHAGQPRAFLDISSL